MTEEERARLRANFQWRLSAPPEEAAAKFLHSYFFDEDPEYSVASVVKDAADNPRPVLAGLECIERLLADPATKPITLHNLVAWHAGIELEDQSDAAAAAWLRAVAEMAREALRDDQPPPPKPSRRASA